MADGREIIFFDESPVPRVDVRDVRELDPPVVGSQLRQDPLTGSWNAVAAHRQARTHRPPADQCPLCPSRNGAHTEIPTDSYDVVVFENRFPAFAPTVEAPSRGDSDHGPFVSSPGRGRCEVVCFTSDHYASLGALDTRRMVTVLRVLAERTVSLATTPEVAYVYCFENRGEAIGVTLLHPHGQIYAMPLVPPRIELLAAALDQSRTRSGECPQCRALTAELAVGDRIVVESEHTVAYVPFAARWPYEIRVVPREHKAMLSALSEEQLVDLAVTYRDVLQRLDRLDATAPVPYIAGWQQAPAGRDDWHLAAEIFTIRRGPQLLKYLAGIESGAGLWINDISPEFAAMQLRASRGAT